MKKTRSLPAKTVSASLDQAWKSISIGEVVEAQNGRGFSKVEWRNKGVPIIRIENLRDPDAKHNHFDGELEDRFKVQNGDLLFAWSGTPGTSFGAHIWRGCDAALNQHIWNVRANTDIVDVLWLRYALDAKVPEFIGKANGGVGLAHITKAKFNASLLDLPPLHAQKSIVSQLEARLSRLDKAVADLKSVEAKLVRHRASVLAAATSGTLVPTEAELARKEGRSYEPASVLLDRILKERRARWEADQLATFRAKGKVPSDDKWKSKYQPPVAPDTTDLPELPEGWVWASMDQIGSVTGGLTKNPNRDKLLIRRPFLRVANVYTNELRLTDMHETGISESEAERVTLNPGDLLVVEGNGSPDQIGRVALWDGSIPNCVHQNHLIKVRAFTDGLMEWAVAFMSSPHGRELIQKVASTTAGLYTLSISKVASLPLPMAPIAELRRILDAIGKHNDSSTVVRLSISKNALRSRSLRSAILQSAFQPPVASVGASHAH